MEEILPGILHWSTFHDGIDQTVHSHLHAPSGAIFDPRLPLGGDAQAIASATLPAAVLLSSRHHVRDAEQLTSELAIPLRLNAAGAEKLRDEGGVPDGAEVEPFEVSGTGTEVLPGVLALELSALSGDETVFHLASGDQPGALLFGDSLINKDGELSFVPDQLLGDDPDAVKDGLRTGLQRIHDSAPPFDALLFAHGAPVESGGREALAAFLGS